MKTIEHISKTCEYSKCNKEFYVSSKNKRQLKKRFCCETCAKISNGINNKGKRRTEEYKKQLSEKLKGKNNPFYGKSHSKKTKKLLSSQRLGIPVEHPIQKLSLKERIIQGVEIDEKGCWIWKNLAHVKGVQNKYGTMRINRSNKKILAHRVSYEAFKGPIPPGKMVLHKCDIPQCVNPKHLFLGTQLENMRDMAKKGRGTIGEKSGKTKLTDEDVIEIRILAKDMLNKDIGEIYGVTSAAIQGIVSRKTWKHL